MRSVLVPVAESTQVYGSERSLRVASSSSTGCSMPARRGAPRGPAGGGVAAPLGDHARAVAADGRGAGGGLTTGEGRERRGGDHPPPQRAHGPRAARPVVRRPFSVAPPRSSPPAGADG